MPILKEVPDYAMIISTNRMRKQTSIDKMLCSPEHKGDLPQLGINLSAISHLRKQH